MVAEPGRCSESLCSAGLQDCRRDERRREEAGLMQSPDRRTALTAVSSGVVEEISEIHCLGPEISEKYLIHIDIITRISYKLCWFLDTINCVGPEIS